MQFSMKQLVLATAFIVIGSFALVYATPFWGSLLFTCSALLLLVGLLMAILTRGRQQAVWLGVIVFGWGYWLLVSPPAGLWAGSGTYNVWSVSFGSGEQPMATSALLRLAYFQVLPLIHIEPQFSPQGRLINNSRYPSEIEYMQVGHSLCSLVFAFLGGWLGGRVFVLARQPTQPPTAPGPVPGV